MSVYKFDDSRKKERFIQIGKSRHRIANDHHSLLVELTDEFRYCSMEQLLFLTSFIGASLLLRLNPMLLFSVRSRSEFSSSAER